MKRIEHPVEIHASAERVWAVLTDFAAYEEWNPFIRAISGVPEEGARLRVRIEPPGGRAMTFRPTVKAAVAGRELRWLGRLWVPGLFDGEHAFRIEPRAEGSSRFVQAETFRGVLVPLFVVTLRKTRQGFVAMNEALKVRAEAG